MLQAAIFTFSPLEENTYVLYNETGNAIIIDPGCYFTAEEEALQQFLEEKKLTPVQLVNTHCHLDHVFGNNWVYKQYGLELYIHPEEEKMLALAPEMGLEWDLGFENYKGPLHFLQEGDVITLGDDNITVILAPGHSPGSICFYCEAQHFVIGGDVLFRESVGRTDLPGGNFDILAKSIRQKLYTLPGNTTIYSGHGGPTTIAHEKIHNPFVKG